MKRLCCIRSFIAECVPGALVITTAGEAFQKSSNNSSKYIHYIDYEQVKTLYLIPPGALQISTESSYTFVSDRGRVDESEEASCTLKTEAKPESEPKPQPSLMHPTFLPSSEDKK